MKKNKRCPKCESNDILEVNGSNPTFISKVGLNNHLNIIKYICCNCGYIEEWVSNSDLEKLKNNKKEDINII